MYCGILLKQDAIPHNNVMSYKKAIQPAFVHYASFYQ
jgi:hypothetical protein